MVSVSASVNLSLHHKVQKFSSGTDSPGWSRKKGHKTVVVVVVVLVERCEWHQACIQLARPIPRVSFFAHLDHLQNGH